MCDQVAVTSLDDAALNLSITESARVEAVSAGRRFAAVAELASRRLGADIAKVRERCAVDATDSCAAEIAADLVISHRKAVAMIYQAVDLRDRIPQTGDLLRDGVITEAVATAASWRTRLVDDELIAAVDADIAQAAGSWGRYPADRIVDAVDAIVERHDPDAVRRFRTAQQQLNVQFGKKDDDTGTRSVFGRVSTIDAELSERRITAMVSAICPDDPRTVGQRRTEAWGVIMAGGEQLPCLCGTPDCPATGPDARGRHLEILVLTDDPDAGTRLEEPPAPDDGPLDPRIDNPDYDMSQHWYDDPPPDADEAPPEDTDDEDGPEEPAEPEPPAEPQEPAAPLEPAEPVEPAASADPTAPTGCGYTTLIAGGRIVPAALLADLRRMGASVRTVVRPEELVAEPRYRPSIALQRMVRARDMTCRFPGCDRPAEYCDFDHAVAYADSRLTHPANSRMLCRRHHLLKTFWVGTRGWSDRQEPDGTIIWTSPSGLEHRAPPGSRIFFPHWDTTTAPPDGPPPTAQPAPGRDRRMPKRRRTRAQQRTADIRAERQRNHDAGEPAPF